MLGRNAVMHGTAMRGRNFAKARRSIPPPRRRELAIGHQPLSHSSRHLRRAMCLHSGAVAEPSRSGHGIGGQRLLRLPFRRPSRSTKALPPAGGEPVLSKTDLGPGEARALCCVRPARRASSSVGADAFGHASAIAATLRRLPALPVLGVAVQIPFQPVIHRRLRALAT